MAAITMDVAEFATKVKEVIANPYGVKRLWLT